MNLNYSMIGNHFVMVYAYIGILVLSVMIVVALYHLIKKRVGALSRAEFLMNPSAQISDEEKAQDKKNCEFVRKIILHGIKIEKNGSGKARKKSVRDFERWQQKQKFVFRMADDKKISLRNELIKKKDFFAFQPKFYQTSPCKENHSRPPGWQLFLHNGFTEPFYTSHDMDDWAIATQLADIFILNGVSFEGSKKFACHIKKYYVNHDLPQGIIQFDLYRMP